MLTQELWISRVFHCSSSDQISVDINVTACVYISYDSCLIGSYICPFLSLLPELPAEEGRMFDFFLQNAISLDRFVHFRFLRDIPYWRGAECL